MGRAPPDASRPAPRTTSVRGFIAPAPWLSVTLFALVGFALAATLLREGLCLTCAGRSLPLVPFLIALLIVPLGRTYAVQRAGAALVVTRGFFFLPLRRARLGPKTRVSVSTTPGRAATIALVDPAGGLPLLLPVGRYAAERAHTIERLLASPVEATRPGVG